MGLEKPHRQNRQLGTVKNWGILMGGMKVEGVECSVKSCDKISFQSFLGSSILFDQCSIATNGFLHLKSCMSWLKD